MTLKHTGALDVLRSVHSKLKKLVDKFDPKMNGSEKERLVADLCHEMSKLSAMEEEVLYPALQDKLEETKSLEDASEAHNHIKVLIAHVQRLMGDEADFDSQFEELATAVKDHLKKEEDEIFSALEKSNADLGQLETDLAAKEADITSPTPSEKQEN